MTCLCIFTQPFSPKLEENKSQNEHFVLKSIFFANLEKNSNFGENDRFFSKFSHYFLQCKIFLVQKRLIYTLQLFNIYRMWFSDFIQYRWGHLGVFQLSETALDLPGFAVHMRHPGKFMVVLDSWELLSVLSVLHKIRNPYSINDKKK